MSTTSLAVKVDSAKLTASFTCLLCNKLFTKATTISECLHTFCRKCIDKKLIDEKLHHCPVCNADLGCSPLDKLRNDHILQELRERIFPIAEETNKATENVPSKTLKKKKSASSPNAKKHNAAEGEFSTPEEPDVAAPEPETDIVAADDKKDEKPSGIEILDEVSSILSARRIKSAARRKFILTELTPTSEPDIVTTEVENKNDAQSEIPKTTVQNSREQEPSEEIVANNISGEDADMFEPLNCLVKTRINNKSATNNNSTMQEKGVTQENDSHHVANAEATIDQNESTAPPNCDSIKVKRVDSTQEKPFKISEDLNLPPEPLISSSDNESNKRFHSIWFSLVPSQEKEAGAQLPELSSPYIRIKDGSLPVSYIKKYLVKKLDLASEAEVEILLRGKPVLSSMQLQSLVEGWLQTMPKSERICSSVGSSAKDFVMVLSYCRKA